MIKKHRLFRAAALATVLVLAGTASWGAWAYRRPLPALKVVPATPSARSVTPLAADAPAIPWPAVGQAAVGAQGYGVFASHGQQTPAPTASVAKLMTALAVLTKKPLAPGQSGPLLTVSQHDIDIYNSYYEQGGSLARVELGEQVSEYDALQALLLPSANNYADMLADWAFGSVANYCHYANDFAKSHGMTHSSFNDASGFMPATVSTAGDLVRLGSLALANPVIAQIVAEPSAVIPVAGTITNVNGLLGLDSINGIKTGNTDAAGGVFLAAAKHTLADGRPTEVIAAVMGGADLASAMRSSVPLLAAVKSNFNTRTAIKAGQRFGSVVTPWDNRQTNIVATRDAALAAWDGAPITTTGNFAAIRAGQPAGSPAGTVTVSQGTRSTAVTLKLATAVTAPSFWWRLWR